MCKADETRAEGFKVIADGDDASFVTHGIYKPNSGSDAYTTGICMVIGETWRSVLSMHCPPLLGSASPAVAVIALLITRPAYPWAMVAKLLDTTNQRAVDGCGTPFLMALSPLTAGRAMLDSCSRNSMHVPPGGIPQ